MYCSNCGSKLNESLKCDNCGFQAAPQETNKKEKSSFWANIVSFFYPIAGLLFFLNWEDKEPEKAKNAGKSAIAGIIIQYALIILIPIFALLAISLIFKFVL